MGAKSDGEAKGYSFQWKIVNVGHCCWLKKGERIVSPYFIANALQGTKWFLSFIPMEEENENAVGLYLCRQGTHSGPDVIEVSFQLSFLGKDGSNLTKGTALKKGFSNIDYWGWDNFKRERIFVTEREAFLSEDTMNVQCTMWITDEKPAKSNYLYATTVIKLKERSFVWKIDKISTLKSSMSNKFRDYLIEFCPTLTEGVNRLDLVMTSFDDSIKYISCNTSIIDSEGRKESCGIKKYFRNDIKKAPISFMLLFPNTLIENKSRYFPNDVLTLDFEFVLWTVKDACCSRSYIELENEFVGKKSQIMATLIDDLKPLFNDGILSDTELRTSTKTFSAHKIILSARSSVFRGMFSNDMENSGHIDITDFEDDTIHRMLLFMYTDSLNGLDFESATKLYRIADKYRILSLKSRCSSILKEDFTLTNACDALVLADLYNDDNLKNAAQDYILGESKQIFDSQEWKYFMSAHLKLAADLMHRKLTQSNILTIMDS